MDEENYELLIDEEYASFSVEEGEDLSPIIADFIDSYSKNQDKPVEEWLGIKMQEQLPDEDPEAVQQMANEIVASIKVTEDKKESLSGAISDGKSKESWFASEIKTATSVMSTQETVQFLDDLDAAVNQANEALTQTITTKSSLINQSPHMDGFIAEQYHAQTFNMNAVAQGSPYRARVLTPKGTRYEKNSVDIVIEDANGNVVRKYQSKYYKNADATSKAFEQGDYTGQRKLVPEDQVEDIPKKVSSVLESPDGVTSNPLTKSRAEQMRDEAQSGNWNDLNWNEYATKDLAIGIGRQVGYAAIQGAAIGVGIDVAQRIYNGENIEAEEVVETALESGADFGLKSAIAGAVKVGAEKNIIKAIPKGTPASTISNVVFVAVEDAKIFKDIVTGGLTWKEGVEKIEQTTVSAAAGLIAAGKGAAIGASVGSLLGPPGTAVGGFIGGTIGYMAGSAVGDEVVKGAQKIGAAALNVAESVVKKGAIAITSAVETAGDFVSGIIGFL